jgi:hypothetical protein
VTEGSGDVGNTLHQKRLPLNNLTLPVVDLIEQIDVAVFVDPDLATDQVRD